MRLLDARAVAQPDAQQTRAVRRWIDQQQRPGGSCAGQRAVQHGQVAGGSVRQRQVSSGRTCSDGTDSSARRRAVRGPADQQHIARRAAGRQWSRGHVVERQRIAAEQARTRMCTSRPRQRNAQPRARRARACRPGARRAAHRRRSGASGRARHDRPRWPTSTNAVWPRPMGSMRTLRLLIAWFSDPPPTATTSTGAASGPTGSSVGQAASVNTTICPRALGRGGDLARRPAPALRGWPQPPAPGCARAKRRARRVRRADSTARLASRRRESSSTRSVGRSAARRSMPRALAPHRSGSARRPSPACCAEASRTSARWRGGSLGVAGRASASAASAATSSCSSSSSVSGGQRRRDRPGRGARQIGPQEQRRDAHPPATAVAASGSDRSAAPPAARPGPAGARNRSSQDARRSAGRRARPRPAVDRSTGARSAGRGSCTRRPARPATSR